MHRTQSKHCLTLCCILHCEFHPGVDVAQWTWNLFSQIEWAQGNPVATQYFQVQKGREAVWKNMVPNPDGGEFLYFQSPKGSYLATFFSLCSVQHRESSAGLKSGVAVAHLDQLDL